MPTLEISDSTAFALDCFNTDTLFSCPQSITCLSIADPPTNIPSTLFNGSDRLAGATLAKPLSADQLSEVLRRLNALEEIRWLSSLPPPDGIFELIKAHCPKVIKFECAPQYYELFTLRTNLPKWDAPSLPLLATLGITSLSLCRLSQSGAQAFAVLLRDLGEDASLEELRVDFVWFDDQLCDRIVEVGRKLKKLEIGTSGTKFSDKGLASLLEGCEFLEEFALEEVQGRLSRNAWSKLTCVPPSLRSLRIVVSETGSHHSWTADHFASLHTFPMDRLETLTIRCKEACPRLENGVPVYDPPVDDVFALKHISEQLVQSVKSAVHLRGFECDLWSFSVADLKCIVSACTKLETIHISLDEPFAKLLSCSSFSSLAGLHSLRISVAPEHAPGQPPVPLIPTSATVNGSLPTPVDSPVLASKPIIPAISDLATKPNCGNILDLDDPSSPHLRDVKRFMRKCPKIELLEWYGKFGRGTWNATRPATATKTTVGVTVEFRPPAITEDLYQTMAVEKNVEELEKMGFSFKDFAREGQEWIGEEAAKFASSGWQDELVSSSPKRRKHSLPSLPALSNSKSSEEAEPVPPLTPPMSESSASGEWSPTISTSWKEAETGMRDGGSRQRRPSEPGSGRGKNVKVRARSATNGFSSKGMNAKDDQASLVQSSSQGSSKGHRKSVSASIHDGIHGPRSKGGLTQSRSQKAL